MRVLGLDIGTKTIGIAVSDPLGLTAQSLITLQRKNRQKDIERLQKLIKEYGVELVVVGLPRNMNGTTGRQAENVISFAAKIEKELDVPVEYYDERLTTVAAGRLLLEADLSRKRRRKVIDRVAAAYMLQGFLDRQRQNKV